MAIKITTIIKIGLMIFAPLLITKCEPINAPKIWPNPIIIPISIATFPKNKNTDNETRFPIKFNGLAFILAWDTLDPSSTTNANIQIEPVPGPKKPL